MEPENVTLKNLPEYLAYLITEFYRNDLEPFYTALDEDVAWVGSLHGQYVRSRQALVQAFKEEPKLLRFTVGTIFTEVIPHGAEQCDTVSFFERTARYPDGTEQLRNLVYHLSWVKKERWVMSVISIMERPERDEQDRIYQLHPPKAHTAQLSGSRRLVLREKGKDNTLFIRPEAVEWAETAGHYCVVHFGGSFPVTVACELRELVRMAGGTLLLCHSGFAVNPEYVASVSRFRVTLEDGTTVPIPEKRYTEVKRALTARLEEN